MSDSVAGFTDQELWARQDVQAALAEDLGAGDLLAGLVGTREVTARVLAREPGVLAGRAWAEAAMAATCAPAEAAWEWQVDEGGTFAADSVIATVRGPAAGVMAGERVMLNYLHLLCGVATAARALAEAAAPVPVYDTRKTLPKLRMAQKHACRVGGMHSNRATLHEAALIKDNHIKAAGSIAAALDYARQGSPEERIQIEVASREELEQALAAQAKRIMLDNFTVADTKAAVELVAGRAELEASGGITAATAAAYATTGVDRLSCGAVTKELATPDLSLELC